MDNRVWLGVPTSPCKDCKKRFLGCHDSNRCKKWAEYVIAKKAVHQRRQEYYQQKVDEKTSLARHGKKSTRKKDR